MKWLVYPKRYQRVSETILIVGPITSVAEGIGVRLIAAELGIGVNLLGRSLGLY